MSNYVINPSRFEVCCPSCCPFASIYEAKQALTTVQKQRFVCWFSGTSLSSIWNQTCCAGTGTFAMSDGIDQGFSITAGTTANNSSNMNFNGIQHYDEDSLCFIAVAQRVGAASAAQIGLSSITSLGGAAQYAMLSNDTAQTCWILNVDDGTCNTVICTCVAICTNFRTVKLDYMCTSIDAFFDCSACSAATRCGLVPTVGQNPLFRIFNRCGGAGKEGRIRYLEVYNT